MASHDKKSSESEEIAKLIEALQQRAGQRLSASDLRVDTGVPKIRIRKLLERRPRDSRIRISKTRPYEFWWNETAEEPSFPLRLFSWEVLSRRVAKKNWTGQPFYRITCLPFSLLLLIGIILG